LKVAIIGSGWFGCHLAYQLIRRNIKVTLFEQNKAIFSETSGKNTSKLHLGFHYPRSKVTRVQAKLNFERFMEAYPQMVEDTLSYYAIAKEKSLIDFDTYLDILDATKLNYEKIPIEKENLVEVEGIIKTNEKNINIEIAKTFFTEQLKQAIKYNCKIETVVPNDKSVLVNGEHFDFCINTTNNHFLPFRKSHVIYEQIVIPLYKVNNQKLANASYVIMDGPFVSINPYYKNGKVLISTYHTIFSILKKSEHAPPKFNLEDKEIQKAVQKIEESVSHFYPNFKAETQLVGYEITNRTKNKDANANRECFIQKEHRIMHVFSGKISSIFNAEDAVIEWLDEKL